MSAVRNPAVSSAEELAEDIRRYLKETLKINYVRGIDAVLFADARLDSEDILMVLYHFCGQYSVSLKQMFPFRGEVTLLSVAEYILDNVRTDKNNTDCHSR